MWLGLLLGIIFGLGAWFLSKKGIVVKWYNWVLMALAFLSIYAGIAHYWSSVKWEAEPTAGQLGLAIFGSIGIVLLVVAIVLVLRQKDKGTAV